MTQKVATVMVVDGGRIALTKPVCKRMGVQKGDSVQIWELQEGIFAISKVIPPTIDLTGKGHQVIFGGA